MKQVGQYDLVILSEVIEHLREVREELARVHSLLAPEGKVLVRTRLYPATDALTNWWYARDKTHINFFSTKALAEAARLAGRSTVECLAEDMFIWA
jgi:SAM-dependent methyltransferase